MEEALYPLEFMVAGTPLSLQAKGSANLERWRGDVRGAGLARRDSVAEMAFLDPTPVAATILYIAAAPMLGDVDNIVKPILDALKGVAYVDDNQVERVVVQKFEPGAERSFLSPSEQLAAALDQAPPVVYVRIDADLAWRILA